MTPNSVHPPLRWLASSLMCLALTACNTPPTALDMHFGDAVKQAQAQQTLHADLPPCQHGMDPATCPMAPQSGMRENMHENMREHMRKHQRSQAADTDGVSAQAAVTRYQDSFKSPPPPAPVFNIGLGSASAR